MLKRLTDIIGAFAGLLVLSPLLCVILFFVWKQDGHSPFYISDRVGRDGTPFRMLKIRSMVILADLASVESTSATDARITPIGHFVRRWKLDELSQLWNVLIGDMSLVGPRPNTVREVASYTPAERRLLTVKPGITDISSIVFSDEGEILRDALDPDRAYSELVRPWKSRLGLVYIENASWLLDIQLIWITILAIFNKPLSLKRIAQILGRQEADAVLIQIVRREQPLRPSPLP
jgi:lipopolysaccharide/colanic/teichoic acid biosynthesis glycosyltransferase